MPEFQKLFDQLPESTQRAIVPALELFLAFEQQYKQTAPATVAATSTK